MPTALDFSHVVSSIGRRDQTGAQSFHKAGLRNAVLSIVSPVLDIRHQRPACSREAGFGLVRYAGRLSIVRKVEGADLSSGNPNREKPVLGRHPRRNNYGQRVEDLCSKS